MLSTISVPFYSFQQKNNYLSKSRGGPGAARAIGSLWTVSRVLRRRHGRSPEASGLCLHSVSLTLSVDDLGLESWGDGYFSQHFEHLDTTVTGPVADEKSAASLLLFVQVKHFLPSSFSVSHSVKLISAPLGVPGDF